MAYFFHGEIANSIAVDFGSLDGLPSLLTNKASVYSRRPGSLKRAVYKNWKYVLPEIASYQIGSRDVCADSRKALTTNNGKIDTVTGDISGSFNTLTLY